MTETKSNITLPRIFLKFGRSLTERELDAASLPASCRQSGTVDLGAVFRSAQQTSVARVARQSIADLAYHKKDSNVQNVCFFWQN